jgi:hypothetical protein
MRSRASEAAAVRLPMSEIPVGVIAMVSFPREPIGHDDADVPPPLFKMTPVAQATHRGGRSAGVSTRLGLGGAPDTLN